VYKSSDSQLTAGTALYHLKKNQLSALAPAVFDIEVLTANPEAFKLADALTKKVSNFSDVAALPLVLMKKRGVVVASSDKPKNSNPDEVEAVTPKAKKVVLVPKERVVISGEGERVITEPDAGVQADGNTGGGVPAWVWIATGVVVAAGAGVGIYFGYQAANKPVTGTVTATW
jgi:hypothetical protein